ncbi:MAG: hypothetical protein ICV70_02195 [Jiangellaceae bacterium]|nr:hypothetical protein [Jiangellaceae bacterium]
MEDDVDAMVAEAVRSVRDRFGADGLRDLVALARAEIDRSERAVDGRLDELAEPTAAPAETLDSADTQAWIAYTESNPEPANDE